MREIIGRFHSPLKFSKPIIGIEKSKLAINVFAQVSPEYLVLFNKETKTLELLSVFICLLLVNWNYHSWKKKKERGELREELRAL